MTPKQFVFYERERKALIADIEQQIIEDRESVVIPHESWLRKPEPKDLKVGAIYFGKNDQGWYFVIVIRISNDRYFWGDDGCGYSTENLFVEK